MKRAIQLTFLLLVLFVLGCQDSVMFTGPDGVVTDEDPGQPGDWSEPIPAQPRSFVEFFGIGDEVGGRWVFEIDWDSAANDVDFIVFEEAEGCAVPTQIDLLEGLAPCPALARDLGPGKPRRVDFVAEPGSNFVLTARNNGPGAENVRLREIFFR